MLKSPGTLCIADLDKEDGSFHGRDFTGHKGFDRKELSAKTEKAGFSHIRFDTVKELNKLVDTGVNKVFPLFLMTAEKSGYHI